MNKIGRNDPCPCGSGKKYKQCCLQRDEALAAIGSTETVSIAKLFQTALGYHQAGRLPQAEALCQKILHVAPNHPDALHLSGLMAGQAGNSMTAIELISKAVSANPSNPVYYNNLGIALKDQGNLDAAVTHFRKALSIKPDSAETHYNLGNILQDQGNLDEAVEHYRSAILLKPDYTDAYNNLGIALKDQGNLDAVVEHFRKVLSLKPDSAEVYNNLGNVLQEQGKIDAAVTCYRKALSLKPDFAIAYSTLLLLHSYRALLEPLEYLSLARGWEQACVPAQDRQAARDRTFLRLPFAGRRLRVGYVSGDFRQHAVSYFVEQLFAHHDRSRIELFAYSTSSKRDAVTERLQALVDHWIPLTGVPDAVARECIEASGIDVLIDLSGHMADNRLGVFARRAAPVQAYYLGSMASTGLTEMDYWIGDEILTPPETDSHFSEQVWRLPRISWSYDGKEAPPPNWQPDQGGTVWVGSFNNLGKLAPATLAIWAKILHALPEGKLLLKTKELADVGNRQRILDGMVDHGIARDRIELQDSNITLGWADHMAYYNRLDIALDPVGAMGGVTTTCDALWMAVPVIAPQGDRVASRATATMLGALGHPEWIAHSEAEYVDKVVTLARNVEYRKVLRSTQRNQMAHSPLCDAHGLAMNLENAYFEMFDRWLGKQK